MQHRSKDDIVRCGLEIRAFKDDRWGVTTEFEKDGFDVFAAVGADDGADAGGAGKVDVLHANPVPSTSISAGRLIPVTTITLTLTSL